MTDPIGSSGFGAANTSGAEETEASVYVDAEGLHLRAGAVIKLGDDAGGVATIDGTQTHKDLPLYGLANADFGDGPPEPSMNLMAGVGPYERTVRNIAGLVAYWRLGETTGTAAVDLVNSRNGTYTGGYTLGADGALVTGEFPSGLRDKAVTLNGTTGYVTIPTATALHPGDTFSIVAWVKKAADGTNMTILSAGLGDFTFFSNTANCLAMNKIGTAASILGSQTFTGTDWHMVAVTKSGSTQALYVDGVVDPAPTETNQTIVAAAVALNIGRNVNGSNLFWNGTLDEVALFNVALTAEDVAALYEVGHEPYYDKSLAGSNFMSNWRFVQSSNMNITAKQVQDTSSPSGSNLRFTLGSNGVATDEAFVEQIEDIGGSRSRINGSALRATFYTVSASDVNIMGVLRGQYLDVDGNIVGSEFEDLGPPVVGATTTMFLNTFASGASPPTDAKYMRTRLMMKRGSAATSATAVFDFTDGRQDRAVGGVVLGERDAGSSYAPGVIYQNAGYIIMIPAASATTSLAYNGSLFRVTGVPIQSSEMAAPSTPEGGYLTTYADTSGVFHTLNDAGVDFPLGPSGTFTPVLAYVTVGTSTWAPSVQVGSYTRTGNRCYYDIHYTGVPTNGTGSGNLILSGLPYTAQTLTNYAASGACAINGYTKAGYTMVVGSVISAVNTMLFRASGTAVAQAHLAVGDIPTGGSVDIRVSGSYVVA